MQHALQTLVVRRTRNMYAIARTLARLVPPLPLAGFGLGVALLVTGALVSHGYIASVREDASMLARDQHALDELNGLEHALADDLGAFRAYLIAPTDGNAQLYESAQERSRTAIDAVRQLASTDGEIDRTLVNLAEAQALSVRGAMSLATAGRASATEDSDVPAMSMLAVSDALERERTRLRGRVTSRNAHIAGQLQQARLANVLATATSLGLLLVFGWLMTQFLGQRNRAAKALRDMNANLEQLVSSRTAQLTELSQHLLNVREEERAALAREIHDQLGSELSTMMIDTSQLEALVRSGRAVPESAWRRLKATLQEMTTAHRRIINSLHPSVLDHLGLAAAIGALLRDLRERSGIATHVVCEGELDSLPDGLPIAVYRIVQEAVNNVVRHAHATTVRVRLLRKHDVLTVEISDDGIGIQGHSRTKGRLGLVGMRERAHNLGGTFKVATRPNRGTTVTAVLPVPRPRSAARQ